ncbi:MAG: hypothetical protein AAB665_01715 [Patescibacteria group bacterium]
MENATCEHEGCGKHCHRKFKAHHHSFAGGIWMIGWLFTIGFLKLSFWYGVLAVIIWPYYLGAALSVVQ